MEDGHPETRRCGTCKKTAADAQVDELKCCAKCKTNRYCSRECQKTDWKTHKKTCSQKASQNTSSNARNSLKNLETPISDPFTRLSKHTYLHNRAGTDVFKLLIDCFRMRQEDDYKFEGDIDSGSVYDGGTSSINGFRTFMQKVNDKNERLGLLPSWWIASKQDECEQYGLRASNWSNLKTVIEKKDIQDHYDDSQMPMQLRMLGETIYGRGPGGQDGTAMRDMMVAMEGGQLGGMSMSHLSLG